MSSPKLHALGTQAPFFYDWPCILETDISGSFVVTPLYLEGCRRDAKSEDRAIESTGQCIRAFIVGSADGPRLLTSSASEVEALSGKAIYVRVDVMSAHE